MNIKRFSEIAGRTIEILPEQTRYGYSLSDYEDLWDIQDWLNNGGYQGSTIHFYDLYNGQVYTPFEKEMLCMHHLIFMMVIFIFYRVISI